MGHFLFGEETVKRFTNVYLQCKLKRIRKMSTLPPLEKFLRTSMPSTPLKAISHTESNVLFKQRTELAFRRRLANVTAPVVRR